MNRLLATPYRTRVAFQLGVLCPKHGNRNFSTCEVKRSSPYSPAGKSTYLITGSLGQLGMEIAAKLRAQHGIDSVLCTDIRKPDKSQNATLEGPYRYLDVLDEHRLEKIIVEHEIDVVFHLSALLSAVGEQYPEKAMRVNNDGTKNVLEMAKIHKLKVFCPSTIGAFGPTTPADMTPDLTVMRPNTMYGVTKVFMELLGEYYHSRYGVDFRSLRLPGIISSDHAPGGGTTDYAVKIFAHLFEHPGKPFECYLREDSELPMMHIVDCVNGIDEFMKTDSDQLTMRTYNLGAISFTPVQLADSIRRHFPDFEIVCKPDKRQMIADSWPNSFDDSLARRDWGWKHQYDMDTMVDTMIERIAQKYHG
eukprot:m.8538 g.8538  ORF g.8538 m.8538 type:complete len:363 (-) comp3913_c0_seq1:118-1206(-)